MSVSDDRRSQGVMRVPFEAMVEVDGALGPSFEAQAVNLSEDGMQLRTAYLPEIGQPLTCRFDAGVLGAVTVRGEVVWNDEQGKGGEFGIRFVGLDPSNVVLLQRVLGIDAAKPEALRSPSLIGKGSRVRLHIDGLGSPMRARVRQASEAELTAYSELGFLQVGKALELEDATTGEKRPAHIDRVEVQLASGTNVPELVVGLKYDDAEARLGQASRASVAPHAEEPHVHHDEPVSARVHAPEPDPFAQPSTAARVEESIVDASSLLRGAVARGAERVLPALRSVADRAKTTAFLLVNKRRARAEDAPVRRTTAPAPGGGLHTSGRRVVRGEGSDSARSLVDPPAMPMVSRKRLAIGGAVGVAVILAAVAMRKPAHPPAPAEGATTTVASAAPEGPAAAAPPAANAPPSAVPATATGATATNSPRPESAAGADEMAGADHHAAKKPHASPFSNGPVAHGNVLRLKMDGTIDKIDGAPQPTGFTVSLPARHSLEAAGPLAARDGRIASIRVSNDAAGAELTVAFKDGVPNYQVRARGDVLEIVIAAPGSLAAVAPVTHAAGKHDVASTGKHHHHAKR